MVTPAQVQQPQLLATVPISQHTSAQHSLFQLLLLLTLLWGTQQQQPHLQPLVVAASILQHRSAQHSSVQLLLLLTLLLTLLQQH